jgi:hypothetical protein
VNVAQPWVADRSDVASPKISDPGVLAIQHGLVDELPRMEVRLARAGHRVNAAGGFHSS